MEYADWQVPFSQLAFSNHFHQTNGLLDFPCQTLNENALRVLSITQIVFPTDVKIPYIFGSTHFIEESEKRVGDNDAFANLRLLIFAGLMRLEYYRCLTIGFFGIFHTKFL